MEQETMIEMIEATAEDVKEICALETLSFASPWPVEFIYEDLCLNKNPYFLAKVGQEAVGYAAIWVILDEAHLNNICVHPNHRERGYGRRLLQFALEEAKKRGAQSMTLEVRVSNAPAIELYKDFGFEIASVRKGYYQDTKEDAYIMWKHGL